jgi:hypothetical protein
MLEHLEINEYSRLIIDESLRKLVKIFSCLGQLDVAFLIIGDNAFFFKILDQISG